MDDFSSEIIATEDAEIFLRRKGSGPPLLLLHGFPQTHLMWRDVAPLLADELTVICADLRGYGASSCPSSTADHAPYSKRALAADMVAVMAKLGFTRFAVAGHDRGGRVAYRLALDHPETITKLAVLDIVPTAEAWDRADARFALGFWPWTLLAQPEPLPERLIAAAPDAIIDSALNGWGSPASTFSSAVRAAYIEALRSPGHIHAICEEYRAAAAIDREHDAEDQRDGRRIACPVLALWSAEGALAQWYQADGGPLAIWRRWAVAVEGGAVAGGHFFPEERPMATVDALHMFFMAPA
ncbi:alpha/beta hydrolase [Bosea sp. Root483D1]|uniref:alpha/beta fold hydrolase n=1 Tax=Bosea sp. Root483D1 TaxID=1736544 RepID=UPI00070FD1C6|nr:alpha/beta hydrolase [Bosea sp. Root483D1]KRE23982.1 alpha/beta hydrolase [Bosea sp. Root483D1]